MKKSLVFLFALSGAVLAADYTWVGPEGGDWATSANWDLNNGYYPQSNSDHAIIGDNKSVIWSSCQYFGATNIVTLGNQPKSLDSLLLRNWQLFFDLPPPKDKLHPQSDSFFSAIFPK